MSDRIQENYEKIQQINNGKLIRFNNVMRDGFQSLMGTRPSADEIIFANQNAHLVGSSMIQTGGGTFFDAFAKYGRDEWSEVDKIFSHFQEKDVRQSVLIRGDCLFGYKPYSFDVVLATVREFARMGVNVFQNFHGLNDANAMAGVAKAIQIVREEEGHDIIAQGTVCIEDNPNIKIDELLKVIEQLVELGHEAIYFKSASGRHNPDFHYKLVGDTIDKVFRGQIDQHFHFPYGDAPICLHAGTSAAVERNLGIGNDTQNSALAGSTAHPSCSLMMSLFKSDDLLEPHLPELNFEALEADSANLQRIRFRYRDSESCYDPELLETMRAVRAPGGATASLKAVDQLVPSIEGAIMAKTGKKPSWTEVQKVIYETQALIDEALGSPTQVTPYAYNTSKQAAFSYLQMTMGKDPLEVLIPETLDYLAGKFGRVPEGVDPDLQKRALEKLGLDKVEPYVPSIERHEKTLEQAKQQLVQKGIKNPSDRQAISVVMTNAGIDHVVECTNCTNTPKSPPDLPSYAIPELKPEQTNESWLLMSEKPVQGLKHNEARKIVTALGGIPQLEYFSQQALFLKQLDDGLNPFPEGLEWKREHWYDTRIGRLTKFMRDIPKKLAEHNVRGFSKTKPSSDLTKQWTLHKVEEILRDALDHRGTGLFDFTMEQIHGPEQHHLYANVDAVYDEHEARQKQEPSPEMP